MLTDLVGHLVQDLREVRLLVLVLFETIDAPLLPVLRADVVIIIQLVLECLTNLLEGLLGASR